MTGHNRGLVACYAAVFLFGLNGLFAKLIALDAASITQLRSVIAAFIIFLFCLLTRRRYRLAKTSDIFIVYSIGVFLGVHWATYFHSMQIASIALGMLSLYTFPLITVFLEPFFSNKKLKKTDLFAAIILMLGIITIAYDGINTENENILLGVFWGVLSAFFFSLRNLIQKYHLAHISSDCSMLHQLIAVALTFMLFVDYERVVALTNKDLVLLIILAIVSTAGAHILWIIALKKLAVKTVAMLGCLQPLIAAAVAWFILGEQLSYYLAVGGAIILSVALYESLQTNSFK